MLRARYGSYRQALGSYRRERVKDSHYHFCKDCVHYPEVTTEEVKRGRQTYIVQKCRDKSKSGTWWLKSDYGKIMHTCPEFEPSQIEMEGL